MFLILPAYLRSAWLRRNLCEICPPHLSSVQYLLDYVAWWHDLQWLIMTYTCFEGSYFFMVNLWKMGFFMELKATQICYQLYHGCDGWAWEDTYWLSFYNGMGLSLRYWWWRLLFTWCWCLFTFRVDIIMGSMSLNVRLTDILFTPWVSFFMPGFLWWWLMESARFHE